MGNCIIVLRGQSRYDVLIRATEEIADGFRKYSGLPVQEIDITTQSGVEMLLSIVNDSEIKPEFIFCMQAILFDTIFSIGKILPDVREYPFWGAIFDYPFYHDERISYVNNKNMYVSCINASDIRYIQRYHSVQAEYLHFLPHGGFVNTGSRIEFKDKIPAVFFSGSYMEEDGCWKEIEFLSNNERYIVEQWITILEQTKLEERSHHFCLQRIIENLASSTGANIGIKEEKNVLDTLFEKVDNYVRARSRTNVIRALLEEGIPVAVVGENWDKFSGNNKDLLTIISDSGGLPIDEVIRLMSNFQIVLNVSDTFSQGGHERIPTTMLCGSICLSNPSTYLLEKYKDRQEILYYDPNHLSTLPKQVKWVWENQAEAEKLAQKAYEKALTADTWQHRAKEILEVIRKQKGQKKV